MMTSLKAHFQRFLESDPTRLHFAAHSHHPWPDISFEAQQQCWLDAASRIDDKWDHIFGVVIPEAQKHIARELELPDPSSLAFAPNTHELLNRLLSCLPRQPRIVTTDSEFHSAERQFRRLEETLEATVERVPAEPIATFGERLNTAARRAPVDLIFFSHVFFNSGAIVPGLEALVAALPSKPMIVIDGYHGFLAVPTSLQQVASRAHYLAGGYKYAMAGEGVCFLHAPPSEWVPRNTGWFASFGALEDKASGTVGFAPGGGKFLGATFDPSGLYRFNAVMRWRGHVGLTTVRSIDWVRSLQERFVSSTSLPRAALMVPTATERGQFLTYRTAQARSWTQALRAKNVMTDARDDRFRIGFGVYHDPHDVDALQRVCGSLR